MKRFLSFAMLVLALSVWANAQTQSQPPTGSPMQNAPVKKSPLAPYAGSWIGTFEGHTWLTFRLVQQGTQIAGTVQRPHDFQFNNNGGIKSVSQDQVTGGVENAVLQGDGLLLTVKDAGTQQVDRYVMRLTGPDTAEVRAVGMSVPS